MLATFALLAKIFINTKSVTVLSANMVYFILNKNDNLMCFIISISGKILSTYRVNYSSKHGNKTEVCLGDVTHE